ncbi:alpha/beta hydrolase [Vampirovibrio sp.]|uniref:alpha/beta hydrolase n=1 Tax=Vampirovibrio sp. TaxID=2717857 RepID=UPI0035937DB4
MFSKKQKAEPGQLGNIRPKTGQSSTRQPVTASLSPLQTNAPKVPSHLRSKMHRALSAYPRWVLEPSPSKAEQRERTEKTGLHGPSQLPSQRALDALKPDQKVSVSIQKDRIAFLPKTPKKQGMIIYPGAMVDFQSYAAMARQFAERGYTTVIAHMPHNMILVGSQKADSIIQEFPAVKAWAIAGHSLGGAMAQKYITGKPDPKVKGVAFWASFPFVDLSQKKMEMVFIQGSNDNLFGKHIFYDFQRLMPKDTPVIELKGGNHSQFGDYGLQFPDLAATMSRKEQQKAIVDITTAMLSRMKPHSS